MYKKLLVASAILGVTACGSQNNEEDTSPTSSPAVITGTTKATFSNTETEISYLLGIIDNDADEDYFVALENITTSYGVFNLTTEGEWTYTLDKNNNAVISLTSGHTLTESITINSIDGTSQIIQLTITSDTEEITAPLVGSPGDNDSVPTVSCTETFDSISALTDAATYEITPGTTLCLEDGIYDDDFELEFGGTGTETLPSVLFSTVV